MKKSLIRLSVLIQIATTTGFMLYSANAHASPRPQLAHSMSLECDDHLTNTLPNYVRIIEIYLELHQGQPEETKWVIDAITESNLPVNPFAKLKTVIGIQMSYALSQAMSPTMSSYWPKIRSHFSSAKQMRAEIESDQNVRAKETSRMRGLLLTDSLSIRNWNGNFEVTDSPNGSIFAIDEGYSVALHRVTSDGKIVPLPIQTMKGSLAGGFSIDSDNYLEITTGSRDGYKNSRFDKSYNLVSTCEFPISKFNSFKSVRLGNGKLVSINVQGHPFSIWTCEPGPVLSPYATAELPTNFNSFISFAGRTFITSAYGWTKTPWLYEITDDLRLVSLRKMVKGRSGNVRFENDSPFPILKIKDGEASHELWYTEKHGRLGDIQLLPLSYHDLEKSPPKAFVIRSSSSDYIVLKSSDSFQIYRYGSQGKTELVAEYKSKAPKTWHQSSPIRRPVEVTEASAMGAYQHTDGFAYITYTEMNNLLLFNFEFDTEELVQLDSVAGAGAPTPPHFVRSSNGEFFIVISNKKEIKTYRPYRGLERRAQ